MAEAADEDAVAESAVVADVHIADQGHARAERVGDAPAVVLDALVERVTGDSVGLEPIVLAAEEAFPVAGELLAVHAAGWAWGDELLSRGPRDRS